MLEHHLEKYFNFSDFRPGQKEIVESILAGRDVVALMPTGGGKSLCYQLPAILSDKISIVISPLIALMKDQVDALRARGISAAYINSSLSFDDITLIKNQILGGEIKILYIAPERFGSASFRNLFSGLDVSLLAVDEAHCVSQWGHDFRPDYRLIKNYLKILPKRPIVAAFTATATPEVKKDIISGLELQEPEVFIRGFDRPNLKFFVQKDIKPKDRYLEVLRIIKSLKGSGIVYALTRKETEFLAGFLNQNDINSAAYHAGMNPAAREKIQNDFMENRFKVIVATIAFGMGVDKADVRFVIHSGMPASLEGYYQEAGRAGRDGETAYCILLHSKKDTNTHKFFIRGSQDEMYSQGKRGEEIRQVVGIKYDRLDRMMDYVESRQCRRKLILRYFDDPDHKKENHNCRGCDICLGWKKKTEEHRMGQNNTESLEEAKRQLISRTVKETVDLYNRGYSVEQMASMRSLGVSTIMGHLTDWYAAGGEIDVDKLVPLHEQSKIIVAISKVGSMDKLGPIKFKLPDNISYEKIRLVVAKIRKGK